jgi:hypothetical protein
VGLCARVGSGEGGYGGPARAVRRAGEKRGLILALLRTILAFMILVILAHLGLVYAGIDEDLNGLTRGIYGLGRLIEIPAEVVIDALPTSAEQRQTIETSGLYLSGLAAAAGYFILFLLLGVGRR